jgi:hypothetical protein
LTIDMTAALTVKERKLLSLAGRGFQFGVHSIDCDRCETRIPYRVTGAGPEERIEVDYKLYGDVILCRLCDAESNGATRADAGRATFIINREGGGVRKIPEPTVYPPGTSIDALLDAPIHGNAYSDSSLSMALTKYAVNGANPINKRRAAIAKLDEIVGEPRPKGSDQEVVNKYMEQMAEYIDEIMAREDI